jgi:tRNA (uracil-5-)-methyltransferase TRM9
MFDLRYYHLFKKGELDDLFAQINGVEIDVSGYDRDNHYVIATKL